MELCGIGRDTEEARNEHETGESTIVNTVIDSLLQGPDPSGAPATCRMTPLSGDCFYRQLCRCVCSITHLNCSIIVKGLLKVVRRMEQDVNPIRGVAQALMLGVVLALPLFIAAALEANRDDQERPCCSRRWRG